MLNYFNTFNIYEYGRKILDRLAMSYERACVEITSTISDSTYSNSEEQVEAISDSEELVESIRDSEDMVGAVSEAKK